MLPNQHFSLNIDYISAILCRYSRQIRPWRCRYGQNESSYIKIQNEIWRNVHWKTDPGPDPVFGYCEIPKSVRLLYWLFQIHLHDQKDLPNVADLGIAASVSSHTFLDMRREEVISLLFPILVDTASYQCYMYVLFCVTFTKCWSRPEAYAVIKAIDLVQGEIRRMSKPWTMHFSCRKQQADK